MRIGDINGGNSPYDRGFDKSLEDRSVSSEKEETLLPVDLPDGVINILEVNKPHEHLGQVFDADQLADIVAREASESCSEAQEIADSLRENWTPAGAGRLDEFLDEIKFRGTLQQKVKKVRLVGIICGQPTQKVVREDIIQKLPYLHNRSHRNVNFFCIGFRKDASPVSDSDFVKSIEELEDKLQWNFSGETDLILLNARYDLLSGKVLLDFETAVSLTFERALEVKAIASVPAFLESIIRFAASQKGDDPTWGFSDSMVPGLANSALKKLLLSLLPEPFRTDANSAFFFYVRNMTRKK